VYSRVDQSLDLWRVLEGSLERVGKGVTEALHDEEEMQVRVGEGRSEEIGRRGCLSEDAIEVATDDGRSGICQPARAGGKRGTQTDPRNLGILDFLKSIDLRWASTFWFS
jgi:hypothetical protein